jgi:hypothetical protein
LVDRLFGGNKLVIDLIPEGHGSDFQFVIYAPFQALGFLDSSNEFPILLQDNISLLKNRIYVGILFNGDNNSLPSNSSTKTFYK